MKKNSLIIFLSYIIPVMFLSYFIFILVNWIQYDIEINVSTNQMEPYTFISNFINNYDIIDGETKEQFTFQRGMYVFTYSLIIFMMILKQLVIVLHIYGTIKNSLKEHNSIFKYTANNYYYALGWFKYIFLNSEAIKTYYVFIARFIPLILIYFTIQTLRFFEISETMEIGIHTVLIIVYFLAEVINIPGSGETFLYRWGVRYINMIIHHRKGVFGICSFMIKTHINYIENLYVKKRIQEQYKSFMSVV